MKGKKMEEKADERTENYLVYLIDCNPSFTSISGEDNVVDYDGIAIIGILKFKGGKICYEGQKVNPELFTSCFPLKWLQKWMK